jgi:NADH dehydrogenase [ubiquinone] 1 alpha subcomplex assembly factor 7
MGLCLGHPRFGYYMTRDPLGAPGDFVTAPEVSQMFGELIGLWCADTWGALGSPALVHLVELGPGRGTLMADALRAVRLVPAFRAAIRLHLVETSPLLRERQRATLQASGFAPAWHDTPESLPGDAPLLVVANEFFDALPVRQVQRTGQGWHERLVGLDAQGRLAFGLSPAPVPGLSRPAPPGTVLEIPEAAAAAMGGLAGRLVAQRGAALVIDYGHLATGTGDTLQAVRGHAFADPLAEPGEADLTVHVDFAAMARAAAVRGAAVYPAREQGGFLRDLGIEARAAALAGAGDPARAAAIEAALARLVGREAPGMGALFKVLAVASPGLGPLAALGEPLASPPVQPTEGGSPP